MGRRAWIAGGSGLVGGHCLRRLLAEPGYEEVHAFVRRELALDDPKLSQHLVPLNEIGRSGPSPPDDAFCAIGTTMSKARSKLAFYHVDHDLILAFAKAAAARGAKRFILITSVSASTSSPNYYLRVKGELETAIALLPFETIVFLRPSFLIGERKEFRLGERIGVPLARAFKYLLFGPMRIFRAIPADDVATGMVSAALHAPPGRHISHYDEILDWGKSLTARSQP